VLYPLVLYPLVLYPLVLYPLVLYPLVLYQEGQVSRLSHTSHFSLHVSRCTLHMCAPHT